MAQTIVGITALFQTLAIRGASVNCYIRSKLLTSCWLFAAYAVAVAPCTSSTSPRRTARSIPIVSGCSSTRAFDKWQIEPIPY